MLGRGVGSAGEALIRRTRYAEALGLAAAFAVACLVERRRGGDEEANRGCVRVTEAARQGRLLARPGTPAGPAPVGLRRLGLGGNCDALLYVPPEYRADRPAPFVLTLHGAGSTGLFGIRPFQPYADRAGLILLAPDSRSRTWDRVLGEYGPDVAFIDRALARVFTRYAVDPTRVAVAGFSDGASYALSLGLTNGDLFTHVIAFAPGFLAPVVAHERPRVYVSHGTGDRVLPIESCSRRIVPELRRAGYDVCYREFTGAHAVPASLSREAVAWLVEGPRGSQPAPPSEVDQHRQCDGQHQAQHRRVTPRRP